MYCCNEASYICYSGQTHLCKACKPLGEFQRKFSQCRGGPGCPLGLPHPKAGSMGPFPLGCALCRSEQLGLLKMGVEVFSIGQMKNLVSQGAKAKSVTRKRAVS